MDEFYLQSGEKTLEILKTSADGLSQGEAEARLARDGKNEIIKGKKKGIAGLFFSQFKDLMTLLLVAAAAISGVIAYFSGDLSDLTDTGIILFIILLNAVVGTVQEYRADKAIENLKKMSAATVKVRRDGKLRTLPSEQLVAGDIVVLEEGDVVPADCRLLNGSGLACDESALTGESEPVEKSPKNIYSPLPLAARSNCLYNSAFVVRGGGSAVVCATGMNTEMGKIAAMIEENAAEPTPLAKTLNKLGKILTAFVLLVTALVFVLGVFVRGDGFLDNFMTAVAIAVAAIPEGLPAVVTIIMAMGVQKMSRKNVVVRRLQSVETLGGCSVICTDKTGTLTLNKMKVVALRTQDAEQSLKCMSACCNVKSSANGFTGDPTEIALKVYAAAERGDFHCERLDEKSFSSERKMMSVAVSAEGKNTLYCKGAPEIILKKCAYISTNSGVRGITDGDISAAERESSALGDGALRVLALARADYAGGEIIEENLTFLGLVAMEDGLKEGVKEAVAECRAAGITTVMITGDSARTALAVAKKLKIADKESEVLEGDELDKMKKEERERAIAGCRVFARVSPKHKNIIVRALQKKGKVVAMTGDGVNDAPSVKSADIGISMGISGTDVTKSASDMVITDDNFPTIVCAVREGRRISQNIRKTVRFFLSTNLAEVLSILIAAIFFSKYAFLVSTQLLWLNLITDSFPVLALGAEKEERDVMKRPPERAESSLFCRRSVANMLFFGIYLTILTVTAFAVGLKLWGNGVAVTVAFTVISFGELFHSFNIRSERGSVFSKDFFSNKILLVTVAAGVILNVFLCLGPFAGAFGLVKLSAAQWAMAVCLPLSVIPAGEIYKVALRSRTRKYARKMRRGA